MGALCASPANIKANEDPDDYDQVPLTDERPPENAPPETVARPKSNTRGIVSEESYESRSDRLAAGAPPATHQIENIGSGDETPAIPDMPAEIPPPPMHQKSSEAEVTAILTKHKSQSKLEELPEGPLQNNPIVTISRPKLPTRPPPQGSDTHMRSQSANIPRPLPPVPSQDESTPVPVMAEQNAIMTKTKSQMKLDDEQNNTITIHRKDSVPISRPKLPTKRPPKVNRPPPSVTSHQRGRTAPNLPTQSKTAAAAPLSGLDDVMARMKAMSVPTDNPATIPPLKPESKEEKETHPTGKKRRRSSGFSGKRRRASSGGMSKILKDATRETAISIAQQIGVMESPDATQLSMNNSALLSRGLTAEQKEIMQQMISYAIVDSPNVKEILMCNSGIDDSFLLKIIDALESEKGKESSVNELWLESNPISDTGMKRLGQFLSTDTKITVVKLYGLKKDISTHVCNEMLELLNNNESIVKFVFPMRHQHQKDKLEKILRRNQEMARQRRLSARRASQTPK